MQEKWHPTRLSRARTETKLWGFQDAVSTTGRRPVPIAYEDLTAEVAPESPDHWPHLLIAGTTGSGKSVGINAVVLQLLYKSAAEHVRLIMNRPEDARAVLRALNRIPTEAVSADTHPRHNGASCDDC